MLRYCFLSFFISCSYASFGQVTSTACYVLLTWNETTICKGDTATFWMRGGPGPGVYTVLSGDRIDVSDTSAVKAFPLTTTDYIFRRTYNSVCYVDIPIRIKVIDSITLNAGHDTAICKGSIVTLSAKSNVNDYSWQPQSQLSNAAMNYAVTKPLDTTTAFYITSQLWHCIKTDTVVVHVFPKPQVYAGADTLVCLNKVVQLQGRAIADSFYWTQNPYLQNAFSVNPLAAPPATTIFTLNAVNKQGCTTAVSDDVLVTVIEKPKAFAGNDTSIVAGAPLQLNASGGSTYLWSPSTGLSATNIASPYVSPPAGIDKIKYTVRAYISPDCYAEDDIVIRYFKDIGIYMPDAFTPNGDGKNDLLFPVLPGIKTLKNFKLFNRWGQMIFNTKTFGHGWDGKLNGKMQTTDVFIYLIEVVDMNNKHITKKGTVALIN